MTTTSTFTGLDPEGRSSSRILRPPGGGSSFSLGFSDQPEQPARRHKMASNIFCIPDDVPIAAPRSQDPGALDSGMCGDSEPPVSLKRTCSMGEYGDAAEPKDEDDSTDNTEAGMEGAEGDCDPEAAASVPAAFPSRRNPPGGKSSLVLG
ncbi:hypothetical protein FKM82_021333 [Ascaphus truei]|uniref:jupiter microtubule associated homolog 1 n=1 Tax=Ascaphus truei TaxID=8439 RepID=UPI003F5A1EEB